MLNDVIQNVKKCVKRTSAKITLGFAVKFYPSRDLKITTNIIDIPKHREMFGLSYVFLLVL